MDKKIVAELRQQLAAMQAKRVAEAKAKKPMKHPPRYDEIYYQGVAALDEDDIPEFPSMSIEDQAARVDPEVREYIGKAWAKEHGLLKDSD